MAGRKGTLLWAVTMSDEGFRPLVEVSVKAFDARSHPGVGGGFQRLEFTQETAPPPEPVVPEEDASDGWAPMAPVAEIETASAERSEGELPEAVRESPEAKDSGLFDVEQQAFDMGFSKGERDGFLKGEERAMEMLVRLENLILGFEGAWRRSCENRERQVVKLALVVAEKVALAKADHDDELAARSLVEALASLDDPGVCTVRVNPTDFQSVERLRGDLFQRIANLQEITILPDPQVDEGEVRLESDDGWLETHARKRLDAVLARVSTAAGLGESHGLV